MPETELVRVVRLTLHPDHVETFLTLFDKVSPRIRATDGCEHLVLLQDATFPNIVSTHSHWRNNEALEAYRKSDFFRSTWEKTRMLFIAPPTAQSYHTIRIAPIT